jgi:hypothetical protein
MRQCNGKVAEGECRDAQMIDESGRFFDLSMEEGSSKDRWGYIEANKGSRFCQNYNEETDILIAASTLGLIPRFFWPEH